MITIYIAIFLSSFIGSILITPIIRNVALRFKIIDIPGGRKIHLEPIPLLGGLGIAIIFLTLFSLFSLVSFEMLGVLFASLIIVIIGLIDDIFGLPPFVKLSFQILAAWLVIICGVSISLTNNPNIDIPLTFLWIVGLTNAFNLLDNMDGLSVGIAGIVSFFFFILGASQGQYLISSLSISLVGACLGFLRYNFHPAKIFMGDTGSMFIGFILSIIGIKLRFSRDAFSWAIPIIALGLPIFDTTLVVISRIIRKVKVSEGGKDHTSHRLVLLGLSHTKAVLLLYLVCMFFGILSLILANVQRNGLFIIILFSSLFIGGIIFFERKWQRKNQSI